MFSTINIYKLDSTCLYITFIALLFSSLSSSHPLLCFTYPDQVSFVVACTLQLLLRGIDCLLRGVVPASCVRPACAPANRKGVISEEKYRQQKDRVMTTGDCMNKNTDPVFIQEIQRMDPCAAHTSRTLQPTRRPRRSTESHALIQRC